MKLVSLTRTCIACPSQWDGLLDDGRPVYIRLRWGFCSVRVGTDASDKWSAVRGAQVLGFDFGGSMNGDMTDEQLVEQLLNAGWEVELKNGWRADNYGEDHFYDRDEHEAATESKDD